MGRSQIFDGLDFVIRRVHCVAHHLLQPCFSCGLHRVGIREVVHYRLESLHRRAHLLESLRNLVAVDERRVYLSGFIDHLPYGFAQIVGIGLNGLEVVIDFDFQPYRVV